MCSRVLTVFKWGFKHNPLVRLTLRLSQTSQCAFVTNTGAKLTACSLWTARQRLIGSLVIMSLVVLYWFLMVHVMLLIFPMGLLLVLYWSFYTPDVPNGTPVGALLVPIGHFILLMFPMGLLLVLYWFLLVILYS